MKNHSFLYIILFFGLLIYPAIVGTTNSRLENKIEKPSSKDSIEVLINTIRSANEITLKQQDTLKEQNIALYAKKPN